MSSTSFPPPSSLNQTLTTPDPSPSSHYSFNSKVMLAAMLILLIVVLFVLSLHVYAKWFWRPRNATLPLYPNGSRWRRSRSLADSTAADETLVPTTGIGLDSATINFLPTFIYQASVHSDATEPLLECAVCLSEFQPYEKGRLLPNCKHSFHIGCIDMWFSSHSTCPLCRAPVSPWMPQQHVHNMSSQSGSTESRGILPEFPSTPRRTSSEQTMMHSPLQDAPSIPTMDRLHAQSISLSPTAPLLQGNSGIQLQEQHQQGLAKDGKQTWKLPTSAKLQASLQSCNVDGTSGSSSTMTNLMSTESRGQLVESGASIARCQSLGVPRCQSEDIEAGSLELQVKSRSFRMSIKRLLSRELSRGSWGRVFPSAAGDVPAEQDQEEQSSVGSRSPPV